jgi:hypothetical protein
LDKEKLIMAGVPDVLTWNQWLDNDANHVMEGINAGIAAGADIICRQEASDDKVWADIRDRLAKLNWSTSKANNAKVINVDLDKFEILEEGNVVYKTGNEPEADRKIESGAGGPGALAGYMPIQWVKVKDKRDGSMSYHLCLHPIASVESGGKVFRDGDPNKPLKPLRWAFWLGLVKKLIEITKPMVASGLPIMVAADWNVSSSTEGGKYLRSLMGKAGFTSAQDKLGPHDTHGDREIDDIYYANCVASSIQVLPKFNSDHSPVRVNFGPKA